jgi:hypothetical protein
MIGATFRAARGGGGAWGDQRRPARLELRRQWRDRAARVLVWPRRVLRESGSARHCRRRYTGYASALPGVVASQSRGDYDADTLLMLRSERAKQS